MQNMTLTGPPSPENLQRAAGLRPTTSNHLPGLSHRER